MMNGNLRLFFFRSVSGVEIYKDAFLIKNEFTKELLIEGEHIKYRFSIDDDISDPLRDIRFKRLRPTLALRLNDYDNKW